MKYISWLVDGYLEAWSLYINHCPSWSSLQMYWFHLWHTHQTRANIWYRKRRPHCTPLGGYITQTHILIECRMSNALENLINIYCELFVNLYSSCRVTEDLLHVTLLFCSILYFHKVPNHMRKTISRYFTRYISSRSHRIITAIKDVIYDSFHLSVQVSVYQQNDTYYFTDSCKTWWEAFSWSTCGMRSSCHLYL